MEIHLGLDNGLLLSYFINKDLAAEKVVALRSKLRVIKAWLN